jgi:hypothetical protein
MLGIVDLPLEPFDGGGTDLDALPMPEIPGEALGSEMLPLPDEVSGALDILPRQGSCGGSGWGTLGQAGTAATVPDALNGAGTRGMCP